MRGIGETRHRQRLGTRILALKRWIDIPAQPIGQAQTRRHLPCVLPVDGDIARQQCNALKGADDGEESGSRRCRAGRAGHSVKDQLLLINRSPGDGGEPTIVGPELELMVPDRYRKIIDKINLPLFIVGNFSLR